MPELRLSEIWIYPVKSLGGIRIQHARILDKGIEFDRRWMLVDNQNRFLTQREYPKMALFLSTIAEREIIIHHKNNASSIRIPLHPHQGTPEKFTIWDDVVEAAEVSTEISRWFSEHLNMSCKLVHFPEKNSRQVDKDFAQNSEHVSLADGYPFLIIGQSSLDDLNTRLHEPVTMKRFRPNFVFTGGLPYEEDQWKNLSIGENRFIGVKNCSRCILTTVNPETAEMGKEPLATLASYRNRNNKIYFGQNLLAIDHSMVHVNDVISLY